jgi:hypothetical protein
LRQVIPQKLDNLKLLLGGESQKLLGVDRHSMAFEKVEQAALSVFADNIAMNRLASLPYLSELPSVRFLGTPLG